VSRVSRRGTTDIQIAHVRKPYVAMAAVVFLVIDSIHLHLLHHLLGRDSGAVAAVIFALIAIRLAWWARMRRR
jgi:hypothetical protein